MSRLRAVLVGFVASLVAVVGLASPAAASGETFGCRIAPGSTFTFSEYCTNDQGAEYYSLAFVVSNPSQSYTYSWSVTGPYQSVIGGCGSSDSGCTVRVRRGAGDLDLSATVTFGGQVLTSYATIVAYCGSWIC